MVVMVKFLVLEEDIAHKKISSLIDLKLGKW